MTIRITCVCLGNICRSPIAQAVLAAELGDLDVEV
ncbi:MAG: low molecular weight phosphotyrosine protein phosphatase, partial [Actinobacteria bacterium]|nr:low molecular weight phosphotyrosine protein phosphatase [Actinomycetota bacterium]